MWSGILCSNCELNTINELDALKKWNHKAVGLKFRFSAGMTNHDVIARKSKFMVSCTEFWAIVNLSFDHLTIGLADRPWTIPHERFLIWDDHQPDLCGWRQMVRPR
jgi:hypothetical protein